MERQAGLLIRRGCFVTAAGNVLRSTTTPNRQLSHLIYSSPSAMVKANSMAGVAPASCECWVLGVG